MVFLDVNLKDSRGRNLVKTAKLKGECNMEKLKELLGEELFEQVKEKLGDTKIMIDDGNFIPKQRFDEVNQQKNEYKDMLKERDEQLKELKKKATDSEELSKKIEELQNQNEQTVSEYEQKLQKQSFDFELERAISKQDAKNVKAVKALLDTEKIKFEDGKLIGLEDQLKEVKENEPYLFGPDLKGREPHKTTQTPPAYKNNPWKVETKNLTEQGRILKEDPELAERLKAEAGVN